MPTAARKRVLDQAGLELRDVLERLTEAYSLTGPELLALLLLTFDAARVPELERAVLLAAMFEAVAKRLHESSEDLLALARATYGSSL